MTPRRWLLGFALGTALILTGCKHCCKRPQQPGCCPPPPGGPLPPGASTLPPQNIPLDPTPGRASQRPPEILLPRDLPPTGSGYAPANSKGNVVLLDPDFGAATPAPAVVEPPVAKQKEKTPPPPAAIDDGAGSSLPVGITNYAQVKEGVSAGLRPDLDGLDWLASKGVKTVLFLRDGKEDDSSDRKQVEKRGMRYVSLNVTPEAVNPELVTEFNRMVNDGTGRPLFVYDLTGTQAGAMWYLYFRTSELLNDDEARIRAGRLGLKEKGNADQTQLWTAVQRYLADRNPKN
jgi:protein tyrosine phosphatase (PTP) superfamily phosphohydrolase (DUF442 family)